MKRGSWAGAVLLVALVAATYAPVWRAGFIWDDDVYVTANPVLRDARGLVAAWTTLDATPQYYPLTHTSLWIDHALWGDDPRGYHAVNVLLHAASAVVFWRVLLLLGVPGALVAAALFAVHPVNVESVAWITERKNTLSGLLYLGSAWVFLDAWIREGRRRLPLALGVLLFAAALLAKTVTASLPVALALAVWWKRGSLTRREVSWLAPMLAAGAMFGAVTRHLETHQLGAEGGAWALAFSDRVVLAGRIVWFYLGKLAWPGELVFIYPRWTVTAASPAAWIAPAAVAGCIVSLFLLRERIGRGVFAAFAFFLVTLAPASGFFNVYPMRYAWVADHFQYLACLGPLALAAAGATTWLMRAAGARPWRRPLGFALASVAVVALAARAHERVPAFADEETLWRDTLAHNPGAWIAHNNLGILLARRGRHAEAEEHFRRVLALEPGHTGALANLGYALELSGRDAEAAEVLGRAVDARPEDADAVVHLTRTLLRLGRTREALPHALAAARLRPEDPDALCDAGTILASLGRAAEGVPYLERAVALRPSFARARANLERARREVGVSSSALGKDASPENAR